MHLNKLSIKNERCALSKTESKQAFEKNVFSKSTNLMVCTHSHLTAHHIFNTELFAVPVIRYLHNGVSSSPKSRLSQKKRQVTGSPLWGSHSCRQLEMREKHIQSDWNPQLWLKLEAIIRKDNYRSYSY